MQISHLNCSLLNTIVYSARFTWSAKLLTSHMIHVKQHHMNSFSDLTSCLPLLKIKQVHVTHFSPDNYP